MTTVVCACMCTSVRVHACTCAECRQVSLLQQFPWDRKTVNANSGKELRSEMSSSGFGMALSSQSSPAMTLVCVF